MPAPPHLRADVIGPGYWALFTIRAIHAETESDRLELINMITNDISSFPCIKPCREHALNYIREHPFGKDMFKWVVDFHNFVNRRQGKSTYDKQMALEEWKPTKVCGERCKKLGPGYWSAFHIRSLNAETNVEKHYAARHICLDIVHFPCLEQREIIKKYMKANPIRKSIVDGNPCSLFNWTVDLHNHLNRLNGKREISRSEAGVLWDPKGFCENCDL